MRFKLNLHQRMVGRLMWFMVAVLVVGVPVASFFIDISLGRAIDNGLRMVGGAVLITLWNMYAESGDERP